MDGVASPAISVVIATYNRPHDLQRCLESLTHVSYPDWDLLIVDQSEAEASQAVVAEFRGRIPRLAYRRVPWRGQTRIWNLALYTARGEIVAYLDDDCTVDSDWLHDVAAVFARYPDEYLAFGQLIPIPHNRASVYIPAFRVRRERVAHGRLSLIVGGGFGGSMYVRRPVPATVERFDAVFGPGSLFMGNDRDFSYRMLADGYGIVYSPRIVVHHYGARDRHDGSLLRYFCHHIRGTGAWHMKLLRCRDVAVLPFIAATLLRCLLKINYLNLVLRREATNVIWLQMYLRGARDSFKVGVDRERCLFRDPVAARARS